MSDNPADIFQQLNEIMKRLMEQRMKDQRDANKPFAYGFRITIHGANAAQKPGTGEGSPAQPSPEGSIEPIAEVYTTDDDVIAAIDLPGVEEGAIHLSLINGTLIVAGGDQFISVDLPAVDPDTMQSSYKNGVLEVRFIRGKSISID